MESNCSFVTPWVVQAFAGCVFYRQQASGYALGVCAIFAWFVVHIMILKVKWRESHSNNAAFWLLLHCCTADLCNLVGSVMAVQMGAQILVGLYLCCMQVVFITQFAVMRCGWRNRLSAMSDQCEDCWYRLRKGRQDEMNMLCVLPFWSMCAGYLCLDTAAWTPVIHPVIHRNPTSRNLLTHNHNMFENSHMSTGYSLGMVSAVLNWTGRLPQILQVYKGKPPPRLYLPISALSVIANFLYALGIITHGAEGDFMLYHLPWLLGSLGTAGIDIGLTIQMYINDHRREKKMPDDIVSLLQHPEDHEASFEKHTGDQDQTWLPLTNITAEEEVPMLDNQHSSIMDLEEPNIAETMENAPKKFEEKFVAPFLGAMNPADKEEFYDSVAKDPKAFLCAYMEMRDFLKPVEFDPEQFGADTTDENSDGALPENEEPPSHPPRAIIKVERISSSDSESPNDSDLEWDFEGVTDEGAWEAGRAQRTADIEPETFPTPDAKLEPNLLDKDDYWFEDELKKGMQGAQEEDLLRHLQQELDRSVKDAERLLKKS
ncbi:lysosomal amino acid transporter 1-like isoform X1 [Branchiostoma floridae]|uniref:Lysosomal amino acid transporter 1-like isoform X1 n=1 Tax=Branchiostoma floridae TaxID=7739 RepID=A0A9J7MAG0_BRAFL|nr:lysosomal amino acid transporter 1-like isoform X1 [Branchiostoma floridae]